MRALMAFFFSSISFASVCQEVVIDSLGSSTFTYSEGDSTYLMKQYFIVFLESGETRDQTTEEAALIQVDHMAYIDSLAKQGV